MNEIAEHEEERHKWAIFQHLNLPKASQKYEYKRLVTVFNRKDGKTSCIEDEPFLVDQVELNARLYNLGLEYEIQDVSAVYILFSYVTLYSFICPFISCIVLLKVSNILGGFCDNGIAQGFSSSHPDLPPACRVIRT